MPGEFAVLYRWRLHAGKQEQFVDAWNTVTLHLREEHGSLGSRLHLGNDGMWYSYARWPSALAREQAFASPRPQAIAEAGARMREAIEQEMPEVMLHLTSDYFV
jgi:quinol monooxygenase YgiN